MAATSTVTDSNESDKKHKPASVNNRIPTGDIPFIEIQAFKIWQPQLWLVFTEIILVILNPFENDN